MNKIKIDEKIIEFFVKEPERQFYVRELARILKKSPATISKYLKDYKRKEVLKGEKKYSHLLFKANNEGKEFKQLKINYNLNLIKNSGIADFLSKELNNPKAIVLFGSFAKGEDAEKSDIDLLVITSAKKELNLDIFDKKLGRKIQLFLFSEKEIEKMKESNKELLNSLINGIILYGFFEVFK